MNNKNGAIKDLWRSTFSLTNECTLRVARWNVNLHKDRQSSNYNYYKIGVRFYIQNRRAKA